ncbi:methionyl-tRNA formyltransferase [Maribacter sp. PR1]|uniref:Methionyl-tRNA formyltransferase n=1 Tax=Maribacter cobaltidurans TaxID=1178778 RepID=A0ABU7ISV4_9FLAO|nr:MULTISPECIES: methionyl-tRNA formyltransferase [Maribacter]MDC6388669.1 methionyl-tRNA formyltransferase [Maribacter sp. PR1]MEE1976058.1 methionyl-tRNA formyltransferase [Maribacter cobaltidurans]
MKELRIVFMGTPDFAVGILDAILKKDYNVVGVVTAPDRPAGRGRKLNQSAVKKYVENEGLPILQPTNLKSEEFLKDLKGLHANLQIVVAFRMLPKVVWQMPDYGTFNLHASLLPEYRGAAPINWAIINGESKTGVTTFFIDEKIDTGAIILQKEINILPDEDAGSLHDKLMVLGSETVLNTIGRIAAGNFQTVQQKNSKELKLAHKIQRDTCRIDWNQSIDDIYNLIRGLSPYPAAWTVLYNEEDEIITKIYRVSKEIAVHQLKNGSLISNKKELKVAVDGGYIKLKEIQLQGKRKMAIIDVLNGLKLSKSAHLS